MGSARRYQAPASIVLLALVAFWAAVMACRANTEATTWSQAVPPAGNEALVAGRVLLAPTPTTTPRPPEPDWASMVPDDLLLGTPDFTGVAQLTEEQMRAVLWAAGWPPELHHQALSVAWCESKFQPRALGDGGKAVSIWQVHRSPWGSYTGSNPEQWRTDPIAAARAAYAVYLYDVDRGYEPWTQWSCKPTKERNWPS